MKHKNILKSLIEVGHKIIKSTEDGVIFEHADTGVVCIRKAAKAKAAKAKDKKATEQKGFDHGYNGRPAAKQGDAQYMRGYKIGRRRRQQEQE